MNSDQYKRCRSGSKVFGHDLLSILEQEKTDSKYSSDHSEQCPAVYGYLRLSIYCDLLPASPL